MGAFFTVFQGIFADWYVFSIYSKDKTFLLMYYTSEEPIDEDDIFDSYNPSMVTIIYLFDSYYSLKVTIL